MTKNINTIIFVNKSNNRKGEFYDFKIERWRCKN